MRQNLKRLRRQAGMTQPETAKKLGISLRYYKYLESGGREGNCPLWDKLETMFSTSQRVLRENT